MPVAVDDDMDPVMKALSFDEDAEVESLALPGDPEVDVDIDPDEEPSLLKPRPREALLKDDLGAIFDMLPNPSGASVATAAAVHTEAEVAWEADEESEEIVDSEDLNRDLLQRAKSRSADVEVFGWEEGAAASDNAALLSTPDTSEELNLDELDDFDEAAAQALFEQLNAEEYGEPVAVEVMALPEDALEPIEPEEIVAVSLVSEDDDMLTYEAPEEDDAIAEALAGLEPLEEALINEDDAREFGEMVDELLGVIPDQTDQSAEVSDNETFEVIDLFGDLDDEPIALAEEPAVVEPVAVVPELEDAFDEIEDSADFVPDIGQEQDRDVLDSDAELRMALAMIDGEDYGTANIEVEAAEDDFSFELEIDEDESESEELEGDMDISDLLASAEPEPVEIHVDELLLVEEGEGPKSKPIKSGKILSRELMLRSFDEHLASLEGPALDPVHLYLRSGLPVEDNPEQHEIMAAILKARCDFQYFKPLVPDGLAGRFRGYYGLFRQCLEHLETHVPPRGAEQLNAEWDEAWNQIEGALPPSERRRRVA